MKSPNPIAMPGSLKPSCLLYLPCLFLLWGGIGHAQVFRLQTQAYYQSLLPDYQNWLNQNDIGNVLKVERATLQNDQLYLYVMVDYPRWEESLNAWEILKQRFYLDKGYPLEKLLFFTACHINKVSPPGLVLMIQDIPEQPHLKVEVKYNFSSRKVMINQQSLRLRNYNPNMEVSTIKDKPIVVKTKFALKSQAEIYKHILDQAKAIYLPKIQGENQRYGKKVARFNYVPSNSEVLEFAVIGLRQEVLKDEDNLWIGNMLNWLFGNYNYDWRKVENLRFSISCKKVSKDQLSIDCVIDCRYGSGVYLTTDWQKGISMEPEFGWYVQNYTDDFKNILYELFQN